MPTDDPPRDTVPADEVCLARLRLDGWSIAEYTIWVVSARATVWVVVGQVRRARLLTMGSTRAEARWRPSKTRGEARGMRESVAGRARPACGRWRPMPSPPGSRARRVGPSMTSRPERVKDAG
jgi:hypothetical protein